MGLPEQQPVAKGHAHPCTHLCAALHTASCLLNRCRLTLCHALQSFEALNARAVAVVVDPIQSVKGKVVIDAFRWAAGMSVLPAVSPLPVADLASPTGGL